MMKDDVPADIQQEYAVLACAAATRLGNWAEARDLIPSITSKSSDATVLKAMVAIQDHDFDKAHTFISEGRAKLTDSFALLLDESTYYSRGYHLLVMLQVCSIHVT
jgi:hypothetical protein